MVSAFISRNRAVRVRGLLRRLYIAIGLIFFVIFSGILGFVVIEDYPLLDAFYMTITTVATVGYMEVHPLSPSGRLFTSFLIITNIGIFAYAITTVTTFLMEGDFKLLWRDFRMNQKILQLKGHVVVCGYGRIGRQVVEELQQEKQPFVVIEQSEALLEELSQNQNLLFISGDATTDESLQQANIGQAKALIASLPKDADNVFVALTARTMNPQLQIISRASLATSIDKLRRAGCNFVIMPERIGGTHMASIVTKPDIIEFIDLLTSPASSGLYFNEYSMTQLLPAFINKTIDQVDARSNTGANIIGIKTNEGQYLINPPVERVLTPNDHLIVLGNKQQLENFTQRYLLPSVG